MDVKTGLPEFKPPKVMERSKLLNDLVEGLESIHDMRVSK